MDEIPTQPYSTSMPETSCAEHNTTESIPDTTNMVMINQQNYEKMFQLSQELMAPQYMPISGPPMLQHIDQNRQLYQSFPIDSKYRPATSTFQAQSSEFRTTQRPSAFLTHPGLKPLVPYADNAQLQLLNSGHSSTSNSVNKENIYDSSFSQSITHKQDSKIVTDEKRAELRRERNRAAARRSREKRLRFVASLEHENRQLWIQNSTLITELNELKNILLEKKLNK